MDAAINILHLEDNQADALLIERALKKAGVAVCWHRVVDWPTLERALVLDHWDLIIADYNIPGLIFEEGLAFIRNFRPGLPLIVVSGCLGEEKAIDLFKAGVWDLVLKGALSRLAPAIHRALREAAESRAHAAVERSLRDSERRLRLTLDAAELVVWDWAPTIGAFSETGPVGAVFGRTPDYCHRTFSAFLDDIDACDRMRVHDDLLAVASGAGRGSFTLPFRITCPDGSRRWLTAVGSQIHDDAESSSRILGIFRDDTRQKETENRLHDRLELQNALMEAIPSPIFHKDTEGRYRGCNKAFEELFQQPREQIIGNRVDNMTTPENAQVHQDADAQLIAGRQTLVYEAVIHHADGQVREMRVSKATYDHADGSVAGIVGIMTDMTERNQNERRIRQLAIAVEQSPCSIIITDTAGIIEYVNPKFCTTTGFTPAEVIGANPRIQKSGFTPESDYTVLWDTIKAGRIWRGEWLNRRKDGSMYWESISISPVLGDGVTVSHYVGIKEDISERKCTEMALLEAKERAEAANQVRAQFMAMMNHEFHTPLNAIIGFAEIMAGETDASRIDAGFQSYSQLIVDSGRSLLAMLDDILRLSRISSGDGSLRFEPFALYHLIANAVATVRGRAEAASIRLVAELPEPTVAINGDQKALHQALVHILINGIKFSNPGATVRIFVRPFDDGHIAVIVRDTGIGIAAADIQRVMAPFTQADNSLNRRYEGTGIGLPLALRLIEHHGGTLEMTSVVGVGTNVTIHLPADRVIPPQKTLQADIRRPKC